MPARLASLLLVLLALPAVSQQTSQRSSIQERISKKMDWHDQMATGTASQDTTGANSARAQSLHHDAEELQALSVSVYSDLQQLRKGLLAKDLDEKLKRMEKLSKRLRRDMQP
ncbi:MAG TPA: hypothetical protein VKR60_13910 [Candidatus Sulfotelmatobacter sp.]|nr:hypothetical protein [Candidatus Sulfotelmatobacter sp.]